MHLYAVFITERYR